MNHGINPLQSFFRYRQTLSVGICVRKDRYCYDMVAYHRRSIACALVFYRFGVERYVDGGKSCVLHNNYHCRYSVGIQQYPARLQTDKIQEHKQYSADDMRPYHYISLTEFFGKYRGVADSIDYLEDKTGKRAEGICFSMQTLISKIGMALTAFVTLLVLGLAGYDNADKVVTQDIINNMT